MKEVLENIRNFDVDGVLSPFLESNAAEFSAARGDLLSDAWVMENRAAAGMDPGDEAELLECARAIREDDTLAFLHFHCQRLAYDFTSLYDAIRHWPSFEPLLPGRSGVFLLLVALTAVPRIRRIHAAMNIPSDITADTCGDVASRVMISKEFNNGKIGAGNTCVNWLRHHVKGDLLQFGRLQFHVLIMGEPFRVYQRLADGEYLMVVEPGQRFTSEGHGDGAGERLAADHWCSDWREEDGVVTANQVTPDGRARKNPVTFKKDEWRLILDGASAVLNTHIPRGPKVTLEDWRQSIRRGFDFFETGRASAKPVACVCRSWMFDPRLQMLLPETSGMVALQRRLRLYPLRTTSTRCGLYFIFGDNDIDLDTAPRDTSLRRAVIDHLKGGGVLTGGGMIVFKDEIDRRLGERD